MQSKGEPPHGLTPNPLLLLNLHDFFHGDFFFVEGFAGDGAVDAHGGELSEVVCIRDTAGSDEVDAGEGLQLSHHLEVRPCQHAVAADVGVNDGIDAIFKKRLDEGQDFLLAAVDPAVGGHGVAVGIDGDRDMVSAVFFCGLDGEVRGRNGFGADDDAPDTVVDMLLDGLIFTD